MTETETGSRHELNDRVWSVNKFKRSPPILPITSPNYTTGDAKLGRCVLCDDWVQTAS